LEHVICHPWYEVRWQVRGSADVSLHAAALGHPPRREGIDVIAGFFRNHILEAYCGIWGIIYGQRAVGPRGRRR
jgi:hypothetical protein